MRLSGTLSMLAMMALLLSSCHRNEPTDKTRVPICIGGGEQADMTPVTRAASHPLEDDFQSFKVWAYKTMEYDADTKIYSDYRNVMDQYIVQWTQNTAGSTTSNTADWDYVGIPNEYAAGTDAGGNPNPQTVKYWDFSATSYRYFGFAPYDESKVEYGESGDKQPNKDAQNNWWYNISFNADATNPNAAPLISKLWFANNPNDYGQTVTMEFLKPVTKVRIRLIDAEGKTIVDPSVAGFTELTFAPANGDAHIVQKGKLKVSYALTGATTVANYLPQVEIVGSPLGTVQINKIDGTYDDWYYVLPHVEQGDYKLSGTIGSSKKEGTVPKEYMSWFPNMEYTYIFKLTDHDFQFIDIVQIGVTEWQAEELTHDIYNW